MNSLEDAVRQYIKHETAKKKYNVAAAAVAAASAALKNAKRYGTKENIRKARHRHTVAFRKFKRAENNRNNAANNRFWSMHNLYQVYSGGNENFAAMHKANRMIHLRSATLARTLQKQALRAMFHPTRRGRRLVNEANAITR